ncbi:MAG: SDR family NAD(P)-dependent oxidoreductase, partial [Planifilum fimeticola]
MKGQTVIVTGGSSGIGKGIAARLCRDGAHVVIIGRDEEKLSRAKEEIETFDGQVLTIPMDVRNPDQVAEMVKKTKERFGRIHHLI